MANISFYKLFQIGKRGRVTSKVSNDDLDELVCLSIANENASVGVDIQLKFGWVDKRERISFMALIWLGAGFDMILP
jgi:hypothetical protein